MKEGVILEFEEEVDKWKIVSCGVVESFLGCKCLVFGYFLSFVVI